MAPRKRRITDLEPSDNSNPAKRASKDQIEELICKRKLEAFEREELQTKEDRFSLAEKKTLLEAYKIEGLDVFQDIKKLHKYLPYRKESDLLGLLNRLKNTAKYKEKAENSQQVDQFHTIDDWTHICQQLVSSFARDKKVNLDDALADSLLALADEICPLPESDGPATSMADDDLKPNYPELLRYFGQLLLGKFPDRPSTANAQISMRLFEHVADFVGSLDRLEPIESLVNGKWLDGVQEVCRRRQESALKGLEEFDMKIKKCPTVLDIKSNKNIEALCLELPKIRRITDVLNPLHIDDSLTGNLMSMFNETST